MLLSITHGFSVGALVKLGPLMVHDSNYKKMVGYVMSFPIFMGLFTGSLVTLFY